MAFTAFRNMKPFSQLMFALFVILVSFFVVMLISVVVSIPFGGIESLKNVALSGNTSSPESMNFLKLFQTAQSIGLFIIPPFVIGWLYSGNAVKYLYLNRSVDSSSVLIVVLLMFFMAPFINFMGELNSNMVFPEWLSGVEQWMRNAEDSAAELTKAFLKVNGIGGLLFNIFMIAMLPALGEELLFRGVIQRIFTGWTHSHHFGIWISAILFSALHMQFFGFFPRMFLGAVFGYMLVWTGSIWIPVIAHFINNAIAVVAMFLIDKGTIGKGIEEIGSTEGSYYTAIISAVLIFVFLLMLKRQNVSKVISA